MLERSFLHHQEIIVYGAGNSYNVFESFVLNKVSYHHPPNIVAHVDKKFTFVGECRREKSVDWLLSSDTVGRLSHVPIVVCIGHQVILQKIMSDLRSIGYCDVFSMFDFWDFHAAYDQRDFIEIREEIKGLHSSFISSKRDMLCDAHSRLVFDEFVSTFLKPNRPCLTQSPVQDEQLEPALKFFNSSSEEHVRVLNTGAYRGEFYNAYSERFPNSTGLLYLLEPNTSNFEQLAYLEDHTRNNALRVKCLNLGVSDIERHVRFSGQGVSARINSRDCSAQDCQVRLVAIDDFFYNVSFTHLVIDIEGHERDFIAGARGVISKFQPNICISIYHHPRDIFDIMTVIENICSGYNFHIRNYSGYNTDTLLYAIKARG
jgi:FkbM family methyltransferase